MFNETLNFKLINILLFVAILSLGYFFLEQVQMIQKILDILVALVPFYIAILIAWLMYPVGEFLNNKTKLSESLSFAVAILINILILFLFFFVLIPLVLFQLMQIVYKFSEVFDSIKINIDSFMSATGLNQTVLTEYYNSIAVGIEKSNIKIDWIKYTSILVGSAGHLISGVFGLFSFIFQIIVAYIISFYLIRDVNKFSMASLKFLAQEKYETKIAVFLDCSNTLFSYVRGVMIDSVIVTVAVTIGLWILGVPSAFLFGVIAGVFNVIPYVGPILGGIPIFIISLSVGMHTFFWSLLVVFGTQFIDGNFIQPKIMSKAMNVHPVSIIVGLIIFGEFFGFFGLVISTPLIGVINVLLKHSKHDIKL